MLGCLCYAKVPNHHDKLLSRDIIVVHIGYSSIQNLYVIYDPANKEFFVNRNVVFHEEAFPFLRKDTSHTLLFSTIKDMHALDSWYPTAIHFSLEQEATDNYEQNQVFPQPLTEVNQLCIPADNP